MRYGLTQGVAAVFDLKPLRPRTTVSTSTRPSDPYDSSDTSPAIRDDISPQCPQGLLQTDSPCPSTELGTWPKCSSTILSASHTCSSSGCCLDLINVILGVIQNSTVNTHPDVDEKLSTRNGIFTRTVTVLLSTPNIMNISSKIEQGLHDSILGESSCFTDFFEFSIACFPLNGTDPSAVARNCSQEWFSGSLDQFKPVLQDGMNYVFFDGIYVSQTWSETKIVFSSLGFNGPYTSSQTKGLCGKRESIVTCTGTLTEPHYSMKSDSGSTLIIYDGIELEETEYEFLENGSVEVCWTFQHLPQNNLPDDASEGNTSIISGSQDGGSSPSILLIYGHVVYALSTLCLILIFVTYCVLPDLRNFQGCSIMSFVASLLVAQVCLQYIAPYVHGRVALCETVAVIAHFTLLSTFAWMTLLAVDLSRSFSGVQARPRHDPANRLKRFARYSLFGWGLPLLLVIICLGLHFTENDVIPLRYGSGRSCWLYPVLANKIFFISPIVISLVANIILFVITVVNIYKTKKMTQVALRKDRTYKNASAELLIYIKVIQSFSICQFTNKNSILVGSPIFGWPIKDIVVIRDFGKKTGFISQMILLHYRQVSLKRIYSTCSVWYLYIVQCQKLCIRAFFDYFQ